MRTLYLECAMGASGDMLAGALLELCADKQRIIDRLNALGLPGVKFSFQPCVKCGIEGTHFEVRINGAPERSYDHHSSDEHNHGHEHNGQGYHGHEHCHSSLSGIADILSGLDLPPQVREDAAAVYGLIAEAESHVHACPVEHIHFHEVGSLDAIADIVSVCLLMRELAPDRVLASAVHVGSGQVHCAHGVLPVPAPATAYILKGVPIYGGSVEGELCTPTGAALLKYFVSGFGEMPQMCVSDIGYGMGSKDFFAANCVRAMFGEEDGGGRIVELSCNLDDITPEALGFAQEQLFLDGALDVYTTSIGMKKNRPGVLLACICREEDAQTLVRSIFKHTTTIGIREKLCRRYTLNRSESTVGTRYGEIRVKTASGWGVSRKKIEYEDIAGIARHENLSLEQARDLIEL